MNYKQAYLESQPKPFPIHAMPRAVQPFVRQAAKSIGVDHSVIALPLLCTLAAAIGNTKRIRLKHGHTEPAIIWGLVIARSGEAKSPAIEAATRSMIDMERAARIANQQAMERWKAEGSKDKADSGPPEIRYVINNPTVQAVMLRLAQNPRGLFLVRQELGVWLGSFNQFNRGGGDEQIWLEMFDGRFASDDRKGGDNRSLHVDSANVSVVGGIQPALLRKAFPRERIASGMLPRFLVTRPASRPALLTDDELPDSARADVDFIVRQLVQVDFGADNGPTIVGVTPEAKEVYREFHNHTAIEAQSLTEGIAAAYSKLRSYALRLALVLHSTDFASCNDFQAELGPVEADTMGRAVELTTWFAHESRRVYDDLDGEGLPPDVADLVAFIKGNGGEASARQLRQARHRKYATSNDAEMALHGLTKAGFGQWRTDKPATGQSYRVLVLDDDIRGELCPAINGHSFGEDGEI